MEGDLAFYARNPDDADLRNLYRPDSGLTLRRLKVLIPRLPPEAAIWQAIDAAHNQALTGADRLRERQAHYAKKGGL